MVWSSLLHATVSPNWKWLARFDDLPRLATLRIVPLYNVEAGFIREPIPTEHIYHLVIKRARPVRVPPIIHLWQLVPLPRPQIVQLNTFCGTDAFRFDVRSAADNHILSHSAHGMVPPGIRHLFPNNRIHLIKFRVFDQLRQLEEFRVIVFKCFRATSYK